MSLLIPDSGLFIWMLVAFAAVLFVLTKFGWPAITGMLDERARYIDEGVAKAREAGEKLEKVQEDTGRLLKEAQEQQTRILEEAARMRQDIIAKAREEATAAAQKVMDEARQQIETEKEDAVRDIRRQVGLLSVEIAEKVLRQNLRTDQAQMDYINRLLDEKEKESI